MSLRPDSVALLLPNGTPLSATIMLRALKLVAFEVFGVDRNFTLHSLRSCWMFKLWMFVADKYTCSYDELFPSNCCMSYTNLHVGIDGPQGHCTLDLSYLKLATSKVISGWVLTCGTALSSLCHTLSLCTHIYTYLYIIHIIHIYICWWRTHRAYTTLTATNFLRHHIYIYIWQPPHHIYSKTSLIERPWDQL